MPKIEFRENKILKLTNVLSRKVPTKEITHQDKQFIMLANWIKAKGYESVGPIIVYNSGLQGTDEDGQPIIESRILVQLKNDHVRLEMPYRFEKELRVENCLLARFHDKAEKLQFAISKLTLFAYENDIELTGETYTILVEQSEEGVLLADVFMPVAKK